MEKLSNGYVISGTNSRETIKLSFTAGEYWAGFIEEDIPSSSDDNLIENIKKMKEQVLFEIDQCIRKEEDSTLEKLKQLKELHEGFEIKSPIVHVDDTLSRIAKSKSKQ